MASKQNKRMFNEEEWSEDQCRTYLSIIRWPDGFCCPHCQATKVWPLKSGRLTCSKCRKQVSVTAGTPLQDTRLPLRTVLLAARHSFASPVGLSAVQLQKAVGLPRYQSAMNLLSRFRSCMAFPDDRMQGRVAVATGPIRTAGSGPSGVPVLAAIATSRQGPHYLFRRILNTDAERLKQNFRTYVQQGAVVLTDAADHWAWLDAESAYRHRPAADQDPLLKRCNNLLGALRDWLQNVHGGAVRTDHLQCYLDEFAFRAEYAEDPELAYTELVRRLIGPRPNRTFLV
ncbi:MAG: IS1595 family transposase [Verrucomicrobia bacterium]|nr:IS1595 family transposase [Verrucomicrobiota bacterium]